MDVHLHLTKVTRCECESDHEVEGLHLEDSDNLEHIQVSTTAKTNEIDCSDKSSDSDCDSESSSPSISRRLVTND